MTLRTPRRKAVAPLDYPPVKIISRGGYSNADERESCGYPA